MHVPTLDEIRELSRTEARGLVTLTLPVIDARQDRIRLKTLLSKARDALEALPLTADDIRDRLQPAERLLESGLAPEGEGLAVLLGPDIHHVWRVPIPLSEQVTVADRWHVAELVPLIETPRFHVLAVELGGWRLLSCDAWQCERVEVPDAPEDVHAATSAVVEPVPGGPSHALRTTGARAGGATRVHPQGFGHEHRKDNDAEAYFRQLWTAVQKVLPDKPTLVLAADDQWAGMLRDLAPFEVQASRLTNPTGASDATLHDAATALLQHQAPSHDAHLERARSEGLVADDPAHVVAAALAGAVDTLLYRPEATVPGAVDRDGGTARAAEQPELGAIDLVDEAVRATLLNGGRPRTVDHLPDDKPMAAILTWELPADSLTTDSGEGAHA